MDERWKMETDLWNIVGVIATSLSVTLEGKGWRRSVRQQPAERKASGDDEVQSADDRAPLQTARRQGTTDDDSKQKLFNCRCSTVSKSVYICKNTNKKASKKTTQKPEEEVRLLFTDQWGVLIKESKRTGRYSLSTVRIIHWNWLLLVGSHQHENDRFVFLLAMFQSWGLDT